MEVAVLDAVFILLLFLKLTGQPDLPWAVVVASQVLKLAELAIRKEQPVQPQAPQTTFQTTVHAPHVIKAYQAQQSKKRPVTVQVYPTQASTALYKSDNRIARC